MNFKMGQLRLSKFEEKKKKKRMKKNEQHLRDLKDTIKNTKICIMRVPEEERKG